MKYLLITMIMAFASVNAHAQKTYVEPDKKQKRSLLEQEEKDSSSLDNIGSSNNAEDKSISPQDQLCECVKLLNMNEQLENRWFYLSQVEKVEIDLDEVRGDKNSIKSTMEFLIAKSRKSKNSVSLKKCVGNEVGEANVSKLHRMIEKQKTKCDVYGLRGMSNGDD